MKRILASACLVLACSAAVADGTNPLLDRNRVQSMTTAKYLDAMRTADVNDRDESGITPLHVAAGFGNAETVTALVDASANIEAPTNEDDTPLDYAVRYGTSETVTALMDAGADVNARAANGATPLNRVARLGTPAVVTALLKAGASGNAWVDDGMTPFDVAAENEKLKGTEAFRELNDAQLPREDSNYAQLRRQDAKTAEDLFCAAIICTAVSDSDCRNDNLRRAAELGLADALFELGLSAQSRSQPKEAVRWWNLAADKGHIKAQMNLGAAHASGYGVSEDLERAKQWYTKAAEQGFTPAMLNVALLLKSGELGAPDPEAAFTWIRRAAEADDSLAAEHLATLYARGEGVERDHAQAYKWIRIARLRRETNDYFFGLIKGVNTRTTREAIDRNIETWRQQADKRHGADYSNQNLSSYRCRNYVLGGLSFFIPDAFFAGRKDGKDSVLFYRPQYHGFHTSFIKARWSRLASDMVGLSTGDALARLEDDYIAGAAKSAARVVVGKRERNEFAGKSALPSGERLECRASRLETSTERVGRWDFPFITREALLFCLPIREADHSRYFSVIVSERFAPSKGVERYADFDDLAAAVFSSVERHDGE